MAESEVTRQTLLRLPYPTEITINDLGTFKGQMLSIETVGDEKVFQVQTDSGYMWTWSVKTKPGDPFIEMIEGEDGSRWCRTTYSE